MIYRCRTKVPTVSEWSEVEADSPDEAAMDFHYESTTGGARMALPALSIRVDGARVYFVIVEVEGHMETVSRVFVSGGWNIARKGGLPPRGPCHQTTIDDIAKALGWTRAPAELLASGWRLEA